MTQILRRERIVKALEQLRPELARLGVQHMYLFGSVARDEARPDSDVDLFLDHRKPGFDLFDLVTVKHMIEQTLGVAADVTTRGSFHPLLRENIEQSAIPVF
ncbi:MAG: nucleotidyltransferase domain-containing protein [Alphaproteobacteria bacterium]